MSGRLPVIVVGAGAMGRTWIEMLATSPHAEAVGIVDLDLALAHRAAEDLAVDAAVGADLAEVAQRSGASAVIDVTVPGAHRAVNEQALRLGLPVLCEKPLAPTLSAALRQVALADVTGQLLMVSQSRRYFNLLTALRDAVRGLGPLGAITQQFFHADHEPGFREQMDHPLLVDMSVHHFDAMRFVTGDEAVSVACESWNPPWSWFRGDAAAVAQFELKSGARFAYSGSRCTPGIPTSWNADWRVHGERGAVAWDGDSVLTADADGVVPVVRAGEENIAGSLAEFVDAVRTGATPQTEVRDNIRTVAMVEGATRSSARGGELVVIDDLLAEAYAQAIEEEPADDVAERLRSWGDVITGISRGHWGSGRRGED